MSLYYGLGLRVEDFGLSVNKRLLALSAENLIVFERFTPFLQVVQSRIRCFLCVLFGTPRLTASPTFG